MLKDDGDSGLDLLASRGVGKIAMDDLGLI